MFREGFFKEMALLLRLIHTSPGEINHLGGKRKQTHELLSLLAYRMRCGVSIPLGNHQESKNPGNSIATGGGRNWAMILKFQSLCFLRNNRLSSLTKSPNFQYQINGRAVDAGVTVASNTLCLVLR